MAAVNPFYRFEDAPEVASIAQGAKRISFATNELYADINNFYTGLTPQEVLSQLYQNQIPLYNLNYNANFVAELVPFPSGSTTAQIYVYETNIVKQYPLIRISMVFELNGNGEIIYNGTFFIGYVNEYYAYGPALLDGEKQAYQALINNSNNAPAVFPPSYKFDSSTGVATSFIARFQDCVFDSNVGFPVRDPIDTEPRGAANFVKLPALKPEGNYVIGLFDQLIRYAQQDGVLYADILARVQSWTPPAEYSLTFSEDPSNAQRLQVDIFNINSGDGYVLLFRDENPYKFQRLYSPNYLAVNFLTEYADNIALPYEPPNYMVRYSNSFYDYDLCLFDDCQFPEKEIYEMPAKAGDVFQFNVLPEISNTEGLESVKVGLFDVEGNLIQQIGETETIECKEISFTSDLFLRNYLFISINGEVDTEQYITVREDWAAIRAMATGFATIAPRTGVIKFLPVTQFGVTEQTPAFTFTTGITGLSTAPFEIDFASPETFCASLAGAFLNIGITFTYTITDYDPDAPDPYEQTPKIIATIAGKICCVSQLRIFFEGTRTIGSLTWVYKVLFAYGSIVQASLPPSQQFCKALIPYQKDGCYRLGLYNKSSAIAGLKSEFEQQPFVEIINYIALVDNLGIAYYLIAIPSSITSVGQLYDWIASGNVPFFDYSGSSGSLTLSIYPYVSLTNWTIQIGGYDFNSGSFAGISFAPFTLDPKDATSQDELYSLSNLIQVNNSDCFSQIIQYYGNDNSIVNGFEYPNNWWQQCRLGINGGGQKPVLTESVYRQSNGVHKRPVSKQDLSVDLHTDFLDLETQSALVDATRHPFFVWKDQSLFVTGDIEVATIQDFTTQTSFEDLAQVKFSALKQGFQPKSSTCVNC